MQEIDLLESIAKKLQTGLNLDPTVTLILEFFWKNIFEHDPSIK